MGNPTIVSNKDAADLVPRDYNKGASKNPFKGGLQSTISKSGIAVYDGEKLIGSYNLGRNLVVDKKYRRQGLAEEMVYQWRSAFPDKAVAETRNKASQRIQEKVWERIQNEKAG